METAVLSVTHKKKPSVLDRSNATAVKEEAKAKEEKAEKDKEEEMEIDNTSATAVVADSAVAVPTATSANSEHKLTEPKRYLHDMQIHEAFKKPLTVLLGDICYFSTAMK